MNAPAVQPEEVLREYYRLLKSPFGGAPKSQIPHAERYLAWCRERGIACPLEWLAFRFECTRGRYKPRLSTLPSEAVARAWLECGHEGRALAARRQRDLERVAGDVFVQRVKDLRILTIGMEAAKEPYLCRGEYSECLRSQRYTGGYHPDSKYCPSCPKLLECAAALHREHGFDVVALRLHRFDALPREVASAALR